MCGPNGILSQILDQAGVVDKPKDVGTIGQPDTAKTQIGDSGAAQVLAQKRKPRSLLSGAAGGDTSSPTTAAPGAKATLGA